MTWLITHPIEVVALLTLLVCTSYVIGAAVWALALAHEERKLAEQREALERALEASQRANQNLQLLQASRAVRASGLAADRKAVS